MDPMPAPLAPRGPDRVVVHASVRWSFAAVLTPLALAILGAAAVLDGGPRGFPLLLLVGGLLLGAVVLVDLPRRVEFDLDGIVRVCWLRRHRLGWREVVAIERSRPSSVTVARNLADRRTSREPAAISGGLLARGQGRRRWLLTDRVESREEHARLAALLARLPQPVTLRAPVPHEGAPPSDLYRRRRGRPGG